MLVPEVVTPNAAKAMEGRRRHRIAKDVVNSFIVTNKGEYKS